MAYAKLSVSIEADVAAMVREAAADEGITVSAWISRAATNWIRNRHLGRAVDEVLNELGGIEPDELADLEADLRAKRIESQPPSSAVA